jgi:tRNA modification GTPase
VASSEEATALTTQRQVELARASNDRLNQALKLLGDNAPRDIVLVELETAAKELTRITGVDTNDAMLDDMFSRFCIGK